MTPDDAHSKTRGLLGLCATVLFATLAIFSLDASSHQAANYRLSLPAAMPWTTFGLNVLGLSVILTFLYSLTNRWLFSALCGALAVIVFIGINTAKLSSLGQPFLPSDFYLVDEIVLLWPVLLDSFRWTFIAFGLVPFAAVMLLYWSWSRGRLRATVRQRAIAGSTSLLCLVLAVLSGVFYPRDLPASLQPIQFSDKLSYEKNGFLLSFFFKLCALETMPRPEGYSARSIEELFSRPEFLGEPSARAQHAERERVDVILVLAEALWDPTQLPVRYSRDPVPFLHRMKAEGRVGSISVPTYGGMTVRTEFEVLTGLPITLLPMTANPYASYIRGPVPALPALFEAAGYQTVAIHPYYGGFWDRAKVFPLLGFQDYLDIDDFQNPSYTGPNLVSDKSLVDKIIEVAAAEGDDPYFMYAISIATHGPYLYGGYGDADIQVESQLSSESEHILTTYVNAARLTDLALERLVGHFRNDARKTLIVIFGDHLPLLGDNYSVYHETGYLSDPKHLNDDMFSAPLITWANYDLPPATTIRSHYLLGYVADLAGLDQGTVDRFNRHARELGPNSVAPEILGDYELVAYDLLFGSQYTLKEARRLKWDPAARRDYVQHLKAKANVETHPPEIIEWGPREGVVGKAFNVQPDGSSSFWFKVEHGSVHTKVELDGQQLGTVYNPAKKSLSARLPADRSLEAGVHRLRLVDPRTNAASDEEMFTVRSLPPERQASLHELDQTATHSDHAKYVAHAGGPVNGRGYTNSLEALDLNYARGFRFFEVDVNWTADRELVLIHDWEQTLKGQFGVEHGPLTLSEFQALTDRDHLTQMTFADLAAWMARNPDANVITDIKEDNVEALTIVASTYEGLKPRVIPQIYSDEEYEAVSQLGFARIILTIYRSGYDDRRVIEVSRNRDLFAVTMPVYRAERGLARDLDAIGVYAYAHTVDDPDEVKVLREVGVDGFYTRLLGPEESDTPTGAAGAAAAAAAPIIQRYGPTSTRVNRGFNLQPDGRAAMWLNVLNGSRSIVVQIGKHELVPDVYTQEKGITKVTVHVPAAVYSVAGEYDVTVLDKTTGRHSAPMPFTVTTR